MHNIKTNYIISSHYSEHLKLEISDRYLNFISIPWYPYFDEFIVEIRDSLGRTYINKPITRSKGQLEISSLIKGTFFANLYIANKYNKYQIDALMYENIMINVEENYKSFILPACIDINRDLIKEIPISKNDLLKYTLSTKGIECHNPRINALAREICKFSHNDYNRLLCIHDWVAQNLFYDMDSYNNGDYAINTHKAIDAIKCEKKCVCSDFTYLTVALARSLKIPSICITCKTENMCSCWNSNSVHNKIIADHVFAASYVNNRWILMDNTWDCSNQILNGVFHKKTQGYDRKYFDVSLEILSSTHRFVDIYI